MTPEMDARRAGSPLADARSRSHDETPVSPMATGALDGADADQPDVTDPPQEAAPEVDLVTRESQVIDLATLLEYAYNRGGSRLSLKALRRLRETARPDDSIFRRAAELSLGDPLLAVPPALLVAAADEGVSPRTRTFVVRLVVRAITPVSPLVVDGGCPAVQSVLDGQSEHIAAAVEQARAVDDDVLVQHGCDGEHATFVANLASTLVLVAAQREEWEPRRTALELDALLWSEAVFGSTPPIVALVAGDRDAALGTLMAITRRELAVSEETRREVEKAAEQRVGYFRRAAELAERERAEATETRAEAESEAARLRDALREAREGLAAVHAQHDDSKAHANYDYERLRAGTLRQTNSHRQLVSEAIEILRNDPHMTDVISDRLEAVLRGLDGQARVLGNRGEQQ